MPRGGGGGSNVSGGTGEPTMVEEAVTAAAEEADDGLKIASQILESRIYESTGKQALS